MSGDAAMKCQFFWGEELTNQLTPLSRDIQIWPFKTVAAILEKSADTHIPFQFFFPEDIKEFHVLPPLSEVNK